MAEELLTLRGQRRAGFVAHEQGSAQLLLEQMDAGAYRGLADIQPLGRTDEIIAADDSRNVLTTSVSISKHQQKYCYKHPKSFVCLN